MTIEHDQAPVQQTEQEIHDEVRRQLVCGWCSGSGQYSDSYGSKPCDCAGGINLDGLIERLVKITLLVQQGKIEVTR